MWKAQSVRFYAFASSHKAATRAIEVWGFLADQEKNDSSGRRVQCVRISCNNHLQPNSHMTRIENHDKPIAEPMSQPKSLSDLFISFTVLALQGFGGVLAVVQRELVENKRWMTNEQFAEEWAVAQIMPGPNVINLCIIIGGRYFGLKGALASMAGILVVPLMLLLVIALVYAQFADHPGVAGALRGMGAVAAGLIIATGLKMLGVIKKHVLGIPLCAVLGGLCFVAVAVLRLPLAYPLIGLGALACGLTYRRIKP